MPAKTELPPALMALLEVGLGLARRAPSARLAIVRAGGILEPEAFTPRAYEAIEREVAAARAATCVPLGGKDVEGLLKGAWGGAPGKVLDAFDAEPVALTPAAQVHRGQFDGQPIAIKVRRPGVERSVRNDLALLDVVGAPLRAAFPRLDAGAILRDVREQVLDELDFEHEASTQRRAARAVRDVPGVTVPRPLLDLCTSDVLVAEWADGTTLSGGARPDDREAAAEALAAAVRAMVLDHGLAPVDLRASHVVVGAGGALSLLGTGTSRPVDRDRARTMLDALVALTADDAGAFGARVEATGLLPADDAAAAHPMLREIGGDLLAGPGVLDADAVRETGVRTWPYAPQLAGIAAAASPHPQDLALGRALGQLAAVLSHLGADADWPAIIRA